MSVSAQIGAYPLRQQHLTPAMGPVATVLTLSNACPVDGETAGAVEDF